MKKLYLLCCLIMLQSCSNVETVFWEEPDYNRLSSHMSIVDKTSNYVIYEYRDVRVDEIAPIAALYCQDRGNKQAILYSIQMHDNNSRRATFVCKKTK